MVLARTVSLFTSEVALAGVEVAVLLHPHQFPLVSSVHSYSLFVAWVSLDPRQFFLCHDGRNLLLAWALTFTPHRFGGPRIHDGMNPSPEGVMSTPLKVLITNVAHNLYWWALLPSLPTV